MRGVLEINISLLTLNPTSDVLFGSFDFQIFWLHI